MANKPIQSNLIIILVFVVIFTSVITSLLTRGLAPAAGSANIEKALTEYIIKNPTAIGNAVKKAYEIEQQQEEESAKQNIVGKKDVLQNDPGSPYIGNKDGSKVLVEFFDYNCGYCKKMLPDIAALVEENKDLKVVFKEIPILGDMSSLASRVSMAVYSYKPEKYWQFHQDLMNSGARTEEQIYEMVKKAGLDVNEVKAKAASEEIGKQLDANVELAQSIGVRGTPAFVAGATLIRGAQGKAAIEEAFKN